MSEKLFDNKIIMRIDCMGCGKEEGEGYVTYGNKYNMCLDCSNEFQEWMYTKLVRGWISKK